MLYKNTKTGAILDSPFAIAGDNWLPYDQEADKNETSEVKEKAVEVKAHPPEDKTGLTKEAVMNELDALGIEYNKKAKKEDLIKLMMGE